MRVKFVIRTVGIPEPIDKLAERVRQRLGLSRSRLYTMILTEYLRELSLLSEAVKDGR